MRNLFQCVNLSLFTTLYMQKCKSVFMHFYQQLLLRPQVRGHHFIPVFWLDHWCIPTCSTAPALQDFARGLLPKSSGNLEHLARWFAPAGSLAASDGPTRSIKPEPQSPGASHMSFSFGQISLWCVFLTLSGIHSAIMLQPQGTGFAGHLRRCTFPKQGLHLASGRAHRCCSRVPCAPQYSGPESPLLYTKCSSFQLELSSWLQDLPQVQGHPGPLRNPGCAQEDRRNFSCHGNWLVPGDLEMAIT